MLGLGFRMGSVASVLAPVVTSSPGVTCASAVTQPAATQRFYLATADRAGTWAKGTGGSAADFSIDPITGIYSVNQSAAGDGSTQLVKTLPVVFTPTDGSRPVSQSITVTLTTTAAPGQISESYNAGLSGAANTPLSSLPGWAISGTGAGNTPVLTGDGRLTGRGSDGGADGTYAVLYSGLSTLAGSVITFTLAQGTDDYNAIRVFVAATDFNNGVGFTLLPRASDLETSNQGWTRQAGTNDVGGHPIASTGYKTDGTIDIVVSVSTDGNTLTASFVGSSTNSVTIDLTGKTKGPKFGFAGLDAYYPAFDTGKFVKAIRAVIPATTLTVTAAPIYSATNTATYHLTWAGNRPTRLQHSFNGTNWFTGDSTVNTDGTITYVASAPTAGLLAAQFRPLNDTPVVVAAPNATHFLANVEPFQFGYNVRPANYYQPVPMLNNWGKFIQIADSGEISVPYAAINGFANVTTNTGVTLTTGHSTLTVVSSNPSTGQHRVQVTADAADTVNRFFRWTGTKPTLFTVVRDGHPEKIAAEWIAGVEGTWLRDLDFSGANSTPVSGGYLVNHVNDPFYANDFGTGPDQPYQDVADGVAAIMAARADFIGYWQVLRPDIPDAEVTARATYQRDYMPQRTKILLQFGNEDTWNVDFPGVMRILADGVRNGYWGSATYNSPLAAKAVADAGAGPGTAQGPAAAMGDWIIFHSYSVGPSIWEAKRAVAAGTDIVEGADWTLRSDVSTDLAGRRWRVVRLNQIIEIYRTVFGSARFASQIMPYVVGFEAAGEIYNNLVVERTFVPGLWDKVAATGFAAYFNENTDTFDTSTATASTLEAAIRANLPAMKNAVMQAVLDCLSMGKVPMFYEAGSGPGPAYSNGGHPDHARYKAAFDGLYASDAGKQLIADVVTFWKQNIPGVLCWYTQVAGGEWSVMQTWADTANPKRQGVLQGLAS